MDWSPDSWRSRPAEQQCEYDDVPRLREVVAQLAAFPKLVTSFEIENLRRHLAAAGEGRSFLLQGGDCSERFADCRSTIIDAKLRILLTMAAVLVHGGGRSVVRVGRIAGQYAKPRSAPTETRDGVTLPSYRGDLVNRPEFTPEARRPDPDNLLAGHYRAAMTLNFVRSLLAGGFGDVHHPRRWDLSFVRHTDGDHSRDYLAVVRSIEQGINFVEAMVGRRFDELGNVEIFTSHEGLHLEYEQAMTAMAPANRRWYNLGTHFPWIGARTCDLGGAHVEYFRGIQNPIGLKVGPGLDPEQLVALVDRLNPDRVPGRLTLIHRMGAAKVARHLPPLVERIRRHGAVVTWCCDPMHGNGYTTADGTKTRRFGDILSELEQSFEIHAELGSVLGGVHFEMTGQDVTEVVGGARGLSEGDLARAYDTTVDPRLNYEQSLEMAFLIAQNMRGRRPSEVSFR